MSKITSIEGRVLFNSRGSKTIEVDIKSDNKFLGRVCAPSGASVGKYEATSFPNGGPEESLKILTQNSQKFIGLDSSDLKTLRSIMECYRAFSKDWLISFPVTRRRLDKFFF